MGSAGRLIDSCRGGPRGEEAVGEVRPAPGAQARAPAPIDQRGAWRAVSVSVGQRMVVMDAWVYCEQRHDGLLPDLGMAQL